MEKDFEYGIPVTLTYIAQNQQGLYRDQVQCLTCLLSLEPQDKLHMKTRFLISQIHTSMELF